MLLENHILSLFFIFPPSETVLALEHVLVQLDFQSL